MGALTVLRLRRNLGAPTWTGDSPISVRIPYVVRVRVRGAPPAGPPAGGRWRAVERMDVREGGAGGGVPDGGAGSEVRAAVVSSEVSAAAAAAAAHGTTGASRTGLLFK